MILVCNIYKDKELVTEIPNTKIINVPYDFTLSLYKNIGLGGLEIEEELFKHDSIFGVQKYTNSIIIWGEGDVEKIVKSFRETRPDEIYLKSIKTNFKHNWISGHKNAVVTLASAIMSANTLVLDDKERIHNNIITWMGTRIGLNIFKL